MTPQRVAPNLGLALLLLAIVASWFWQSPPDSPYRFGYTLLALTTVGLAALALIRPPARNRDDRWWVYAVCLLTIYYPNAYCFDPAQDSPLRVLLWGRVVLQLLASAVLLSLGRSYAMLPALREIRTGFFYSYVRHPVYALYLLADVATVALQPSVWNAAVAVLGGSLFLWRARLEEKVLGRDQAYVCYLQRVRWRFFPGVY